MGVINVLVKCHNGCPIKYNMCRYAVISKYTGSIPSHGGFGRTLRSVAYNILPNLAHLPTIGTRTLSTEEI